MNKNKKRDHQIIEYVTISAGGLPLSYPIFEGISYKKQMKKIEQIARSIELRNLFNLKDLDESDKLMKEETKPCPKCHKRDLKIICDFQRNSEAILTCSCGYHKEINLSKYKKRGNYENR